ncbi:hypothetical protein [Nocardia sp. NPDC003726]
MTDKTDYRTWLAATLTQHGLPPDASPRQAMSAISDEERERVRREAENVRRTRELDGAGPRRQARGRAQTRRAGRERS